MIRYQKLMLFFAVIVSFGSMAQNSKVEEGVKLFEAKDYPGSILAFDEAASNLAKLKDENIAKLYYYRGMSRYFWADELIQSNKAPEDYTDQEGQIFSFFFIDCWADFDLCELYQTASAEYKESIEQMRQALSAYSATFAQSYFAEFYARPPDDVTRGDFLKLVEDCLKIGAEYQPNDINVWFLHGEYYGLLADMDPDAYAKPIEYYKKALDMAPSNATIKFRLGMTLRDLGQVYWVLRDALADTPERKEMLQKQIAAELEALPYLIEAAEAGDIPCDANRQIKMSALLVNGEDDSRDWKAVAEKYGEKYTICVNE